MTTRRSSTMAMVALALGAATALAWPLTHRQASQGFSLGQLESVAALQQSSGAFADAPGVTAGAKQAFAKELAPDSRG